MKYSKEKEKFKKRRSTGDILDAARWLSRPGRPPATSETPTGPLLHSYAIVDSSTEEPVTEAVEVAVVAVVGIAFAAVVVVAAAAAAVVVVAVA